MKDINSSAATVIKGDTATAASAHTNPALRERPILFSGPMVRAILEGRKTQTRRIAKFGVGPPDAPDHVVQPFQGEWIAWWTNNTAASCLKFSREHYAPGSGVVCPYGSPGDRLWVREKWTLYDMIDSESLMGDILYAADNHHEARVIGLEDDVDAATEFQKWQRKLEWMEVAGDGGSNWMPSIHMPWWASRLTLEVTEVRCQRLQAISEADAVAEGIVSRKVGSAKTGRGTVWGTGLDTDWAPTPTLAFANLWESINGPGSWEANPWVWIVSFKVAPNVPASPAGVR